MLSIVIPSYNGADLLAKNLPLLIAFLSQEKVDYEIIVVDDGSNDNGLTKEIALTHKCRFYRHEQNLSKGAAIRTGMRQANGEYRLFRILKTIREMWEPRQR